MTVSENLRNWFKKEDWVRIDSQGNIAGKCGTSKNKKNPDRCLPRKKAQSLTKAERKATAAKKKRAGKKGTQFVKNTKKVKVSLKKESMKKSELKEIIKEEIKKLKSLKEQVTDWDGNCSSVLNTWSDIDDLKGLCMKCNPELGGEGSYYINMDPSPCGCSVPSSGGIMKPLLDFCRDKFTGAELGYGGSTPVGDPVPDPSPAPDDLTVKPTKYSKEPKPSKGKLPGGPTKAKNPSGISILKKMLRDKSRR